MAIGKIVGSGVYYPLGVRVLGLQKVWNQRYTAGCTAPRTWTTSVNGTPAGWSADANFFNSPSGTYSISNVFFDNKQVLTQGDATFDNCEFNNGGAAIASKTKCVAIGANAGGAACSATFTNCLLDGTGMWYYYSPGSPGLTGGSSILSGTAASTITLTNTRVQRTPLANFKTASTGVTTITGCSFGTFAYNPKADSLPNAGWNSHAEMLFFDGGTWNISDTLFDCTGQDTDPLAQVLTGILYAEADTSGDLTVNFTRCIIRGASTMSVASGGTYWMQFAGKNGKTCTVTFNNCAIDPGKGRVVTATTGTVSISGSGNVDLTTGNAFPVAYP